MRPLAALALAAATSLTGAAGAQAPTTPPELLPPPQPAPPPSPGAYPTSTPAITAAEAARAAGKLTPTPSHAELKALWEGGTWSQDIARGGSFMSNFKPGEYILPDFTPSNGVPLKPAPMAVYRNIRREMAHGRQIFGPYAQCHPAGMPYILTIDFSGGYEAVVADNQINFFYGAEREVRRIYLDGRKHPDETKTVPLYNGFSVAHWEGKTMVVETTNIRGSNTQIEPHIPKAEGSYIVERYTPLAPGKMALEMTMRNPEFTRPWVVNFVLTKDPKGVPIEMLCSDDNRWVFIDGELKLLGPDGKALEKAEP